MRAQGGVMEGKVTLSVEVCEKEACGRAHL